MRTFSGKIKEKDYPLISYVPSLCLYIAGGLLCSVFSGIPPSNYINIQISCPFLPSSLTGTPHFNYINIPSFFTILGGDILKYLSLGFKNKKKKIINTIANYMRLSGFMLASVLGAEELVKVYELYNWENPYTHSISLLTHGKEFVNAGLSACISIGMAREGDTGGLFVLPPLLAATCITSGYTPGTSNVAGETLEKLFYTMPFFVGSDLLKKFKKTKKIGDFLNTFGVISYVSMGAYISMGEFNQKFSPLFSSLNDNIAGESLVIGGLFHEGVKGVRRLLTKHKETIDIDQYYDSELEAWLDENGKNFVWANKKIKLSVKEYELNSLSKKILNKNPNLSELEIILNVKKEKDGRWHNWNVKKKIKGRLSEFWNVDKYELGVEGEIKKGCLEYKVIFV